MNKFVWLLMLVAGAANSSTPPIQLEKFRDQAFAIADELATEHHDLDALVEHLDFDPQRAFVYVRDEVTLLPYAGLLRGWQGALDAKAGGNLERAVLLGQLIEQMGYEARLVRGQLATTERHRLRADLLNSTPPANYMALAPVVGLGGNMQSRVAQRAEGDFNKLMAVPGLLNPTRRAPQSSVHFWVQVRTDKQWIDLDPAFAGANFGDRFAVPEEILALDSGDDLATHRVELTVVAVTNLTGETVLLRKTVDVVDVAHQQVYLWFAPQPGPSAGLKLRELLIPGESVLPVLVVDGDVTRGKPVSGFRRSQPLSAAQAFFGADARSRLQAVYLDVSLIAPDGSKKRKRRTLADLSLSDSLAGTGNDLFGHVHQIVISNGAVSGYELSSTLGVSLAYAETHHVRSKDQTALDFIDGWWPYGNFNMAWQLAASEFAISSLHKPGHVLAYQGEPQVTVFSVHPGTEADPDLIQTQIDFMHDAVHVQIQGDENQLLAAQQRLRYATLKSALETEIGLARAAHMNMQQGRVISTSIAMADSSLKPLDRALAEVWAKQAVGVAEDLRQELKIIAVDNGSAATWWAIDAETGAASARIQPGLGGLNVRGHKIYRGGGPGNFGGASSVRTYVIDPKTYRTIEVIDSRNRKVRASMNRPNRHKPKKGGGPEYLTVLEWVSIPVGWHVGIAKGMFVTELVIIALVNVEALD
ncbi:MAG: hypothetical protein AAF529_05965 [Pseudomonadota bacterium]